MRHASDTVVLCMFDKPCYYKHYKANGSKNRKKHAWKKALYICEFDEKCNQQKTMNHIAASRKYGIQK